MTDYIADYLNTLASGTERDEWMTAFAKLLGRGVPHLGFVAQGELPAGYSAGNKFLNFRRRRVAKSRIKAPRLILPNFYISGQNEAGTGSTATLRGAYEQNGQTVAATFSSLSSGSALSGGFVVSDPVESVDIAAGTVYFERGYCQYPGGMPYNLGATGNMQNTSGGDCFEYGASPLTDRTAATGAFTSSDASNVFVTLGTIAMTCDPSLFHLGDSILAGIGDGLRDDSDTLGLTSVLGQFFGGFNAGVGGATSASFVAATRTSRMALAAYATHLIQESSVNALGSTLAQIQADLLAERNLFPSLKAYMTTTTPSGTTTDAGVTVANQTPSGNESKRTALNDWKRLCPEGWQGCIDIADTFEVNASGVKTRNGGRYPAGMSGDMLHPSQAGYLLAKNAGGYLRSLIA